MSKELHRSKALRLAGLAYTEKFADHKATHLLCEVDLQYYFMKYASGNCKLPSNAAMQSLRLH